jgi:hypothetical protein
MWDIEIRSVVAFTINDVEDECHDAVTTVKKWDAAPAGQDFIFWKWSWKFSID